MGFSTFELVIAIAIMMMTSAMVLVSFSGIHKRTAVNRAAREFALAARRVQNISLSVTEVETGFKPTIAQTVGIKIAGGSSDYTIFLDKNENGVFGAGDTVVGRVATLTGGVQVRTIKYIDAGGVERLVSAAHIVATAPEATMWFTAPAGGTLGDILEVEIGTPSGDAIRTVTIRTSGQITVK
ncbi:MAG: hypothetical protein HYT41_01610 [Candidatus Sungbacteria bacterium]|nr:hypothetical protein [Candidatus Sungbacteria bacterium]